MTDDLARELDLVAGSVPPIPNDYASLKALIQTLPRPLAPDIRSATAGVVNATDPGMTAASQIANTLSGGSIGTESGSSIGVVSELFYGVSNLLRNPTMESFTSANILTTDTNMGPAWRAKYVKNSGQDPVSLWFERLYARLDTADNPTNTDLIALYIGSGATGAGDYSVYIYPTDYWNPADIDPDMAYLVAAVKLTVNAYGVDAGTTLWRARMEITTNADIGTLYYGPWLDIKAMADVNTVKRISCAMARPVGGWNDASVAPYRWRLRIDHAMSTAEPANEDVVLIAEPVFSVATTQSPLPFTPMLGKWETHELYRSLAGDTSNRVALGTFNDDPSSGIPYLAFGLGTGSAPDTVLRRQGPALFHITNDATGSTGNAGGLQFGNDVVLLDVNEANRIGIQGVQDATAGGLQFGSAKDTELFRESAGSLRLKNLAGNAFMRTEGDSGAAASYSAFGSNREGDTTARMTVGYDGDAQQTGLFLGPGNAARDVGLYRSSDEKLTLDHAAAVGLVPLIKRKASDQQILNTNVLANVTGLDFAVKVGSVYSVRWVVVFTVDSATTDGIQLAVNGPTGCVPSLRISIPTTGTAGTDAEVVGQRTALENAVTTATIDATGTNRVAIVEGMIYNPSNAGTVNLRAASDTATTGDVTIKAGSFLMLA